MLNRIPPPLPVTAYRTFQIARPVATHFRKATCEEVNCDAWRKGWVSHFNVLTDLGREQANYVRRSSGRKFVEMSYAEYRQTYVTRAKYSGGRADTDRSFVFAAGQTCFAADTHRTPLEREGIYIARDGDYRGNPTGTRRVHVRPADWVDEFAEHQDWLKTLQERG